MHKDDILKELEAIVPKDIIKIDEPLKRYTYTETGGQADYYLSPTTHQQVQAIVHFAYSNDIPVTYLGNGSNIIIREGGIRGIVITYFHSIILKFQMMLLFLEVVLQSLMFHALQGIIV